MLRLRIEGRRNSFCSLCVRQPSSKAFSLVSLTAQSLGESSGRESAVLGVLFGDVTAHDGAQTPSSRERPGTGLYMHEKRQ